MSYDPHINHRRSIRLKGYDYSKAGLYFITICIQNRKCLLGEITNGEMKLNDAGKMVETEWLKLSERFKNIVLHEFVVMPNHFHSILEIVGQPQGIAPTEVIVPSEGIAPTERIFPTRRTIGDMVGAFQSIVTVEYIRGIKTLGWQPFDGKLFQRKYWEHIIRNEQSYHRIAQYILNNPSKWKEDKFNYR